MPSACSMAWLPMAPNMLNGAFIPGSAPGNGRPCGRPWDPTAPISRWNSCGACSSSAGKLCRGLSKATFAASLRLSCTAVGSRVADKIKDLNDFDLETATGRASVICCQTAVECTGPWGARWGEPSPQSQGRLGSRAPAASPPVACSAACPSGAGRSAGWRPPCCLHPRTSSSGCDLEKALPRKWPPS